jgi:uncharacterized C2H2 Zn-finger protein
MTNHYIKNEEGQYVCTAKGCSYTARLMQTMFYHLKKHEESLPFKCNVCRKEFLHKKTLENHMISQHANEKPPREQLFACPACDFASLQKGNLRIHFMRTHMRTESNKYLARDNEGNLSCSSCGECFKATTGFYYHVVDCVSPSCLSAPPVRKALGLPLVGGKGLEHGNERVEVVAEGCESCHEE